MGLFFTVILPIMAVFAAGFILQRIRLLDVNSIALVSIYVFLPVLVVATLYESSFSIGYSAIVVFASFLVGTVVIINKVLAMLFQWSRSIESASILTSAF